MEFPGIRLSITAPLVLSGLGVDDGIVPIDERSISTMPPIIMLARTLAATVLLIATSLSSGLAAQGCSTGTFWQRDSLPAVPSSIPTGVSVIQGLCEGESVGVVFEMAAGMPVQKITKVVAPWGALAGAAGFLAALDVEVYDGVSFNGANVNMGQRVLGLPGCDLRVSLDLTDGIITFGTTGSWSLAIPNQTNLLGSQFYQQAFVFDPPLNSFGGAMSDAAEWLVGN